MNVPLVKDVMCFGDTTVCIADNNDIYLWGVDNMSNPPSRIDEPLLLCHLE
jgi:hypothetical protein